MIRAITILMTLTLASFLVVLTLDRPAETPSAEPPLVIETPPPRTPPPKPSAEDERAFAAGLERLAIEMHPRLAAASPGQNIVWSPYSLAVSLGMLRAVAEPRAIPGIDRVMGWESLGERVHGVFAHQLAEARKTPERVGLANGVWVTPEVGESWAVPELAGDYEAAFGRLTGDSDRDTEAISAWAREQTDGKIERVTPLPSNTQMALVNALLLRLAWDEPFEPKLTELRPFHGADGISRHVWTLRGVLTQASHWRSAEFEIVKLPCVGGAWEVTFAVPSAWRPENPACSAAAAMKAMASRPTDSRTGGFVLELPKFEARSQHDFFNHLLDSGMANPDPRLASINQDAFIFIDEEGVEAAAVTVAALGGSEMVEPEVDTIIRVDRPFFFFLQHRHRLFVTGQVVTTSPNQND